MQAQQLAKRGEFGDDDLLSFMSPEKKLYRELTWVIMVVIIIILHLYFAKSSPTIYNIHLKCIRSKNFLLAYSKELSK